MTIGFAGILKNACCNGLNKNKTNKKNAELLL